MTSSYLTKEMVLKLIEGNLLNGAAKGRMYLACHPDTTIEDSCGLKVRRLSMVSPDHAYLISDPLLDTLNLSFPEGDSK